MRNMLAVLLLLIPEPLMAIELRAIGTFTVSMTPEAGAAQGRTLVTKIFTGDFAGSSQGTMLTEMTPEKGSAAYVLIERVEGVLAGRAGGFALAHFGLMDRGVPQQRVAIVPGSGTGALTGLRGEMTIDLSGGGHGYTLTATLPQE